MKNLLAALAITFALPANAGTLGPYSDVIFFGDSLTDSGNAAALATQFNSGFDFESYPLGQFTNGNTWATQIDAAPSLLGGNNYAYGGARASDNGDVIPDLAAQVNQYLAASPTLGSNPLASIWVGGNDFLDLTRSGNATDPAAVGAFIKDTLTEITSAVQSIATTGVADIVVFGLPDIGKSPNFVNTQFSAAVTGIVDTYNAALQGTVASLNALSAQTSVSYFDVNSVFQQAIGPDNALDYSNWTHACLAHFPDCQGNEDSWVFWDPIHPTDAIHSNIAEAFSGQVSAVPLPAGMPLLLAGLAAFGVMSRRRKSLA